MYEHIYIYTYTYIYIQYVYIHIHTYIYNMYIYTQRHTETEVRDGKVLKRWRCCPEFASDIMGKGIVSVKALRVPRKKEKNSS